MPKDIVGAWIVGEQDKTKDKALGMLGDFVETAVSNKLTKQKTTVYDAGDAIFDNSINNSDTRSQNKSDDEKLAYMLSESLLLKIIQGIYTSYSNYYDNQNEFIIKQLKEKYKPQESTTKSPTR